VLGQRTLHQQLADADAEAAADELDEQETAGGVEFVEFRFDARATVLVSPLLGYDAALTLRRTR